MGHFLGSRGDVAWVEGEVAAWIEARISARDLTEGM